MSLPSKRGCTFSMASTNECHKITTHLQAKCIDLSADDNIPSRWHEKLLWHKGRGVEPSRLVLSSSARDPINAATGGLHRCGIGDRGVPTCWNQEEERRNRQNLGRAMAVAEVIRAGGAEMFVKWMKFSSWQRLAWDRCRPRFSQVIYANLQVARPNLLNPKIFCSSRQYEGSHWVFFSQNSKWVVIL
jgi:hypothetical protein